MSKKILVDTGVWISYFGDRRADQNKRIELAKSVIKYCCEYDVNLYYCYYVEEELKKGEHDNSEKIESMKKIAKELPGHSGNDAWHKIDIPWNRLGTRWGDSKEVDQADQLEQQLPDTQRRSNRMDRKIILAAIQEGIDIFLHENPKDFNKLQDQFQSSKKIDLINMLSLNCLNDFKIKLGENE